CPPSPTFKMHIVGMSEEHIRLLTYSCYRTAAVLVKTRFTMPTDSQKLRSCSLSRHSPYTSKSKPCRLRAGSTRPCSDLSVHGSLLTRSLFHCEILLRNFYLCCFHVVAGIAHDIGILVDQEGVVGL